MNIGPRDASTANADEIENGKLVAMRLSVGHGAEEDPHHGDQAHS
jgi:hypothetical protein